MPLPPNHRPPNHRFHALIATVSGQLLAIPSAAVSAVVVGAVSPPPSGAPPWLDGLALVGETVALAISPFPARGTLAPARTLSLAMSTATWGLVVETLAGFAQVELLPTVAVAIGGCPPRWLRPCRIADGRLAAAIDPDAIGADLAALRRDEAA